MWMWSVIAKLFAKITFCLKFRWAGKCFDEKWSCCFSRYHWTYWHSLLSIHLGFHLWPDGVDNMGWLYFNFCWFAGFSESSTVFQCISHAGLHWVVQRSQCHMLVMKQVVQSHAGWFEKIWWMFPVVTSPAVVSPCWFCGSLLSETLWWMHHLLIASHNKGRIGQFVSMYRYVQCMHTKDE